MSWQFAVNIIALLGGLALSCKGNEQPAPVVTPPSPSTPQSPVVEDHFEIARPVVTRMAVPDRFSARLPATHAELHSLEYPPVSYLQRALITDQAGMRARMFEALTRAAAAGRIPQDVGWWYANALGGLRGESVCAWLFEAAHAHPAAAARKVLWSGIGACDDPATIARLQEPSTPDDVVLDWYGMRSGESVPFSERAVRVAEKLARTGTPRDLRRAGNVFAALAGDEPAHRLRLFLRTLRDPKRAARIAIEMVESASFVGQELGRAACTHPAVELDAACIIGMRVQRGAAASAIQEPLLPAAVVDILGANGRALQFDVESGLVPNQHDAQLYELANLVRPQLDDVIFDEVAPGVEPHEAQYRLYAYAHGLRYEVTAENHGDWYDVEAMLGMLNALLVARGSDQRLVPLATGDQTAIVLAGPGAWIIDLAKRGKIRLAGASDAMRAGKGFEDAVFDRLRGQPATDP